MFDQLLTLSPILIAIIIAALVFDFVNGWNDAANAIATVVATRVFTPFQAVALAAAANLFGALMGVNVAHTITTGILHTDPSVITSDALLVVILSALGAAIVWAAWMTLIGMPISGTHSLIGGLCGAALAAAGPQIIVRSGVEKILAALLISPLLGAFVALLLSVILSWVVYRIHNRVVNGTFRFLQIGSAAAMAFSHGLNDAQKVMGTITLALIAGGIQHVAPGELAYPEDWVRISCALVISVGTAIGGWSVIRTLGMNLSNLKPFDGFNAEAGASAVLGVAASWGIPVSTTHTITGAIIGVGLRGGTRSIKWAIGERILMAWVLTLPGTALIGAAFFYALRAAL